MDKPRSKQQEDEWFFKHERELLEKLRSERRKRLAAKQNAEEKAALEKVRDAHWMHCPKCGHKLHEIEMATVRIDQCEFCEGLFFDRGELEDLLLHKGIHRKTFFRRILGLD